MLTAGGEVRLERRYLWRKGQGGGCPVDGLLGIEQSSVSPGARELCCVMGIGQDFAQASADLSRVGGLRVCRERLRQLVEAEARRVQDRRNRGGLPASWLASQAKLDDGTSLVYTGIDGVMAPMVTQKEKDKRRENHAIRRRQRGRAKVANSKPLPPPRPGSDERFKEMKIGLFYDQDKTRRHAFVAEDLDSFGQLLGAHATHIRLDQADRKLSLTDGAKWIYRQVITWLLCLDAILLDFYHLAQHIHEAARCCLGENETARVWAGARLKEAKASDVAGMLSAIDTLDKKMRSPAKKKSLSGLRQYIHSRREMIDYRAARANGWDIGSGPTEAMCKTLTLRLKRPGMKWDRDNAAGMMNLVALRESGQWPSYWSN